MTRTARKVQELADEGKEMVDALEAVLDRAEEKGAVEWADVKDDITSGQWGRLIETELLVDGAGNGFVIDDPEGVKEALGTADVGSSSSDDDSGWSTWDKLAALGALGLFAGYSMSSIRAMIGEVLNLIIGPLEAALPFYVVVMVLATFTGLSSTILQANLMDMDKMGEYQSKMKEIQERRKEAKERGDDEALDRIQEEQMDAMGDQLGMFKEQFRPMVWIMLVNIPVFLWIYWMILDVGVASGSTTAIVFPIFGEMADWTSPVVGPFQAWILWYFLCSLGFTQIIRKALNIDTTPT
ncbi:DUF106 domain-containing protein [Haloarculaceae archaeon H-GB2-1]|nr:DUF106 domain-containing protein [Haloarculaceae archaeon H-GB1-1]MEA5386193.1 DUF106 domain-containing protein [Haloarculaceae archaeon H-GB11]MEA5407700.1 DUF106 domain-containing protein [Haloarculaceae archaeon H-GB2-1]